MYNGEVVWWKLDGFVCGSHKVFELLLRLHGRETNIKWLGGIFQQLEGVAGDP